MFKDMGPLICQQVYDLTGSESQLFHNVYWLKHQMPYKDLKGESWLTTPTRTIYSNPRDRAS